MIFIFSLLIKFKSDFAVVESIAGEEGPSINDIIPLDQCRHVGLTSPVSTESVKSCTFDVPEDLLNYFARDEDSYKTLQQTVPKVWKMNFEQILITDLITHELWRGQESTYL